MTENAKNVAQTTAEAVAEVADKVKTKAKNIPHQLSGSVENEVVEVEETDSETLVGRVKRAISNKKVIAGASTVALLTAGILVARKRNAAQNDESEDSNNNA